MTFFQWICAVLLYITIGYLVDEVSKDIGEEPRNYILVMIWPVPIILLIVKLLIRLISETNKNIKKAKLVREIKDDDDDLDEWNI